jgi:PAS domain S-box-containing protein
MFYKEQTISLRKEKEKEIVSITDLKVEQIVNWRKERLGDAESIYYSPLIISHFQQWMKGGSSEIKQEILTWMKSLQEHLNYKSIDFLDIKGNILLAVPDGKEVLGPDAKRLADEAIKTRKVTFSDLYRSKIDDVIRITLIVPLLVSHGQDNMPVGVLLLRIDPYTFLYHLVQTWPTPSRTAETLIVRQEGNDVLILNELRHRKDTALKFQIPLREKGFSVAMVTGGQKGIFEGKDYRDVPVLAAIRAIPDSSWFLISKVDQSEIYADLKKQTAIISIIVSLLILASGIGLLFIWRHQAAKSLFKQLEAEHERQMYAQRYEHLTKHANDIILLSEKDGKIVDANERAVENYGYSREEILRLNLSDLRSPEAKPLLNEQLKEIEKRNGMVFETQHQRKDGTLFAVDVSSRIIEIEGKRYYQSIIRDITERKQTEEKIREQLDELKRWHEVMLGREDRIQELKREVNEFCKMMGAEPRYKRQEVK